MTCRRRGLGPTRQRAKGEEDEPTAIEERESKGFVAPLLVITPAPVGGKSAPLIFESPVDPRKPAAYRADPAEEHSTERTRSVD